jgi:hypothetical protein
VFVAAAAVTVAVCLFAFGPGEEPRMTQAALARAAAPTIDAATPAVTSIATFALG